LTSGACAATGGAWRSSPPRGTARRESDETIRRFTALVAHEIRNPLAAIGAGVQYLARLGGGGADERETLAMILSEVKRLDALVGDLARAGRAPAAETARADWSAVAREAVRRAEPSAARRGVGLLLDAHPALPRATIDAAVVGAALEELIENAVMASPAGAEVVVRTGLALGAHVDGAPSAVYARVIDRGAGIDAAAADRIFEPFFTTQSGARGLGLAFCSAVAEAHGGSIRAESEPGRGSTFTLFVPSAAALAPEDRCAAPS